ncbi:TetR/AcrR family transcriptional regulator [uncultured Limnobacter sp.]|uniref:TetR/AcrR family transcriptional regulator n=1 Tax=uncultured Limnobacter sp. TaxID=199681 RepID=UPI0030F99CB9
MTLKWFGKNMTDSIGFVPRRLSPEKRKAEILQAAHRLLVREGLSGFSLDAVAREAGVANSLPRHYFGTYGELLACCAENMLERVIDALVAHPEIPLRSKFERYLDVLASAPWGHQLWMTRGFGHPEVAELALPARRAIMEAIAGRSFNKLSPLQILRISGLLGYVERIVEDWIIGGMVNREMVLDVLIEGMEKLRAEASEV